MRDALVDDAHMYAARSQHLGHARPEEIVVGKHRSCEFCHGHCTNRIATGNVPVGAGPALLSMTPRIGVIRPVTWLPLRVTTKKPIQLATLSVALRPLTLPS